MSISYTINQKFNGVEIKFTEKPSKEVLERLKASGYHWSPNKAIWYAKNNDETLALAKELCKEEGEQIALVLEEIDEETEEAIEAVVEQKPIKKSAPAKKPTPPKKAEKAKAEPIKKVDEKAEAPKKDNIVIFPQKERPSIKVAVRDGNYTYEDCYAKLQKEREVFRDSDSHYVFEGLLAMCKASQNFRNNVMNENKSYAKAFDYFCEMAKSGYAFKYNDTTFFDNDLALAFAIDYFNKADEANDVTTQMKKEG